MNLQRWFDFFSHEEQAEIEERDVSEAHGELLNDLAQSAVLFKRIGDSNPARVVLSRSQLDDASGAMRVALVLLAPDDVYEAARALPREEWFPFLARVVAERAHAAHLARCEECRNAHARGGWGCVAVGAQN